MTKTKYFILVACMFWITACNNDKAAQTKQALPEPDSNGAKLFGSFCDDCHAPPRIASHKPDEWRNIVERMQTHRLKKAYSLLTENEKEELIAYLEKNAS